MAKNDFPMMKSGGGVMKKVVGLLVAIAVIAWFVTSPVDAAKWVKELWHLGTSIVDGIGTFLHQILG